MCKGKIAPNKIILFLILFSSLTASAAGRGRSSSSSSGGGAELNQATVAGSGQGEYRLGSQSSTLDTKITLSGSAGTYKTSTANSFLSYYHGFSSEFNLGFSVGYTNGTQDTSVPSIPYTNSTSQSGVTGASVGYKGNIQGSVLGLFSALTYVSPLGTSSSTTTGNSTTKDGYPEQGSYVVELLPTVKIGSVTVGLDMQSSTNVDGTATSTTSGTKTTNSYTGGGSVSGALILQHDDFFHPNISVANIRTFSNSYTSNTGTKTLVDGNSYLESSFSLRMMFTSNLELNLSAATQSFSENSSLTSGSGSYYSGYLRILL